MRRIVVILAIMMLGGCLSGSQDAAGADQEVARSEDQAKGDPHVEAALLVDHDRGTEYGFDPEPLCDVLGIEEYPMARQANAFVGLNHTVIEISVVLEHLPADGVAGVRVGGTFDGEEMFLGPPFKETGTFEYPLEEPMPDDNGGRQWAFFFKRTDPTTEDDPDACSAGPTAGRTHIQVFAK